MQRYIWWIGGGLVVIAGAVLFFSWRASRHPAAPAAAPPTPVAQAPVAPPAIQNPVPEGRTQQPLPTLEASDPSIHQSLGDLIGKKSVDALLKPEQIIRHFVVTVDNLPRKRAAVELRPTKPAPGAFMAHGDEQHSTLDPANYQRYATWMQVVKTVDTRQLADLYFHYYPLFQQSYQSLGYPNGYFNDRLVAVIDNVLETPDVSGDIVLVRPNVMYQFADPNLEDLSAGQKALLRLGPDNAAIVKGKLREFRALIVTSRRSDQPAASSPAPVH